MERARPECLDFDGFVDSALEQSAVLSPVRTGTLVRVVGLTLEARGLMAPLGALCEIGSAPGTLPIEAEVVGFQGSTLFLMPFGDTAGISPGAVVRRVDEARSAQVGPELLGRVIDGRGMPLDGKPLSFERGERLSPAAHLNPMDRGPVNEVLDVGVRAINGLLTIGRGQRVGLVAGSGVGKSVLLGMITRFAKADVVVIGLIGERGREVQEFINESLGQEGLAKSVVVAAPANVSPLLRLKATHLAHSVAEYFRDQGLSVLLLVDSITRVAHAQREIGLAIGEPPTTKGYPPSVFGLLPSLIERAGPGMKGGGTITALYTVLAEGDDASDPIVDLVRASLDGQIMLSRSLADAAHYPAIDLSGSISRVMTRLVSPEFLHSANRFRRLWTLYQQNRDLIQVGAYRPGTNTELDDAIRLRLQLEHYLRQDMNESSDFQSSCRVIEDLMRI